MVHDSKRLTSLLCAFIHQHVTHSPGASEVSDVKRDGTVFVRFTSTGAVPSSLRCDLFQAALHRAGIVSVRTDECRFRLALDQFRDREGR